MIRIIELIIRLYHCYFVQYIHELDISYFTHIVSVSDHINVGTYVLASILQSFYVTQVSINFFLILHPNFIINACILANCPVLGETSHFFTFRLLFLLKSVEKVELSR